MSESRINLRLTNAVDDSLYRCGRIARADVHWAEVDALLNAQSMRTSIPVHLARQLGIEARQHLKVRGELIAMSGPILFEFGLRSTYDEAFLFGEDVVIGHTVLAKLGMLAECAAQRVRALPADVRSTDADAV
jgi:hypothetical protein